MPFYEIRQAIANNPIQLSSQLTNSNFIDFSLQKVDEGGFITIVPTGASSYLQARKMCNLVFLEVCFWEEVGRILVFFLFWKNLNKDFLMA
jgi:hypothetical protein